MKQKLNTKIKQIILPILISISTNAGAQVVQATGYGKNFEEALRLSKLDALQKVVGTFIIGDTNWSTDNDKVFEQILEYHGGYIKSYEILEFKEGINEVTITADVQIIKDNEMIIGGDTIILNDQFKANLDNFNNKREVIKYLDNPQNAFHFDIKSINATPSIEYVSFKMNASLEWQPKWVSDLKSFVSNAGPEGNTSTDTKEKIASAIVNEIGYNIVGGIVGSIIMPDEPKRSDKPMVCFGEYKNKDVNKCYDFAGGFQNMPAYSEMKVRVIGYGIHDEVLYDQLIITPSSQMYESIGVGQKRRYLFTTTSFNQPTYMIYTKGIEQYTFDVKVENNIAKQINKFKIVAWGN